MAIDYNRVCFVIMPFGTKPVGKQSVDFDRIYDEILEPAINAMPLAEPEGGHLEARRTDKDFFAGDISHEMFNYLEYSSTGIVAIEGLLVCEHSWQPQTFRDSLGLLIDSGVKPDGLSEGIAKLDEVIPLLPD